VVGDFEGAIDLKMASEKTDISPVTLRAQAAKGRLRAAKLGGQWVTTPGHLQQYLDSRARNVGRRLRLSETTAQDTPPVRLDEDLEIWILLHQVWQTTQKAREKELARCGVSLKRSNILFLIMTIAASGKPVTAGEITRWTLLEKHSVFERIKRMEKGGLVRRIPGKGGEKAMELVLTEAGRRALERSEKRESISAMLSALTPEERQQLKIISRKLRDSAVGLIEDYTRRVLL
jgi:DNA-binding MarR family transcriptional regulator